MPKNKIDKLKSVEDIKRFIKQSDTGYNSEYIFKLAGKELEKVKKPKAFDPETNTYKALTLLDFEKGFLLMSVIPERFRIFALEFSRNLQAEYKCKTQGEKSLAGVVSLNYVRILGIQDRINSYLEKGVLTDVGVKFLAIMSKELDKAQRHYISSLQLLRMLKIPPLQMSIKTNTAVVGQNQLVQANTNDKAK